MHGTNHPFSSGTQCYMLPAASPLDARHEPSVFQWHPPGIRFDGCHWSKRWFVLFAQCYMLPVAGSLDARHEPSVFQWHPVLHAPGSKSTGCTARTIRFPVAPAGYPIRWVPLVKKMVRAFCPVLHAPGSRFTGCTARTIRFPVAPSATCSRQQVHWMHGTNHPFSSGTRRVSDSMGATGQKDG